MEKTAKHLDFPEETAYKAMENLEGETLYDVIKGFTRTAQQFPVAERLQIETALSQFLLSAN